VAINLANKAGCALLNVLRHGANALGRHRPALFLGPADIVNVVVGIKPFTEGLDVGFLALVREEWSGLRRLRSRARQCARPHRDVCEELRRLEVVSTRLQKLIVKRLQPGLLRLLLSRTSTKLRLCASKS
jgi:hypothetical protein